MNEIQIFNSPEFGEVRTVLIDNEPWFVGNDVSKILGYANPKVAVQKHVDRDDKLGHQFDTSGQNREMTIINESGLYSLIFGSKLESAKKFKKWVTSEVLPQLRKTGGYALPTTAEGKIQLLAQGNVELNKKVDTLTERMDKLEMDLPILPVEADRITTAVKRRGVSVLGGKHSRAYNNRMLRQQLYNNLYANLKYNFGVRSYKSIKRSQCDKAVEIIARYEPPLFLAEQIEKENI